jgi:hypothetical protein
VRGVQATVPMPRSLHRARTLAAVPWDGCDKFLPAGRRSWLRVRACVCAWRRLRLQHGLPPRDAHPLWRSRSVPGAAAPLRVPVSGRAAFPLPVGAAVSGEFLVGVSGQWRIAACMPDCGGRDVGTRRSKHAGSIREAECACPNAGNGRGGLRRRPPWIL